ncbi:MAG: flagellar assembly protein FliW [Vampirovibrionales bacterium]|jgi:flagellar assembly factor FliW|nr:flagellar assembly protein FliW [Vampirovibrionales bacterium]
MTTSPQLRQINTERFGAVSVDEASIITFVQPILGFDSLKEFALFDHDDESPFKWLQSLEDPALAFVVTNPTLFGHNYEFNLPQEACSILNVQRAEDAQVLTLVTVPEENPLHMTANFLGPIIFHNDTRHAMQLILEDPELYGTKVRLIPDEAIAADGSIHLEVIQSKQTQAQS